MPTAVEINVACDGTHSVPNIPQSMNLGDTVHYSSAEGSVIILFEDGGGSPFLDANNNPIMVITSTAPPLPLKRAGSFVCRCFVTLPNGMTVGWGPNSPQSGGNSVVR